MSFLSSAVNHAVYSSKTYAPILNEFGKESQHDKISWPKIPSPSKIVNNVEAIFPAITSSFASFVTPLNSKLFSQQYPSSVDPKFVLKGNFAPVDETPPTECLVEGELSPFLNGVYIRNGPNPQHPPKGPHHLFEGDGMLHSIKISDGLTIYCSRYVKTNKYKIEHEAGAPVIANIFSGFYSLFDIGRIVNYIISVFMGKLCVCEGIGTANTSLAFFYDKVFAMMEADIPYEIELTDEGDINTKGRFNFNRKAPINMTAHPKIDVKNGEVFAFQCFPMFPYLTLFCFDAFGLKKQQVPIFSLKHPSYVHDFAMTEQYLVFPDTQIEMEVKNLFFCKGLPMKCRTTKISRVGVISRQASSDSEMRWFNVPGFNALHILNALEDNDDAIVIIAPNLLSPDQFFKRMEKEEFSLEKLRIDLNSGEISRTSLSKRSLELGSINPTYQGKKNKYVYMGICESVPKMSGVVKIDLELGCEVATGCYGSDCFGGEVFFVAKRDGKGEECYDEDDGFILTYIHNEITNESKFLVMDAKSPTLDIVASVRLPMRVPYGFHGLFVREDQIKSLKHSIQYGE